MWRASVSDPSGTRSAAESSLMETEVDDLAVSSTSRAASGIYGVERWRKSGSMEAARLSWRADSNKIKSGGIIRSALLWRRSRSDRLLGLSSPDGSDVGDTRETSLALAVGIPRSASADDHLAMEKMENKPEARRSLRGPSDSESQARESATSKRKSRAEVLASSCGSTTPCSSPGPSRRRNTNHSTERGKSASPNSDPEATHDEARVAQPKRSKAELDAAAGEAILEALRVCGPTVDPDLVAPKYRRPFVSTWRQGRMSASAGEDNEEEVVAAVAAALAWSPSRCAEQRWDQTIEEASCEGDDDEESAIHIVGGDKGVPYTNNGGESILGETNLGEGQRDATSGGESGGGNDHGGGDGDADSGEEEDEEDSVGSEEASLLTFGDLVNRSSLKRLEAQRLALTSSPSPTDSGSAPGASWIEGDTAALPRSISIGRSVDWLERVPSPLEFHTRDREFASADIGVGVSERHVDGPSSRPFDSVSEEHSGDRVGGGHSSAIDHPSLARMREEVGSRVTDAPANSKEDGNPDSVLSREGEQYSRQVLGASDEGIKEGNGLPGTTVARVQHPSPPDADTTVDEKGLDGFAVFDLSPCGCIRPRSPSGAGDPRDGDELLDLPARHGSSSADRNKPVGDEGEGEPLLMDEGVPSNPFRERLHWSVQRRVDIERMSTSSGLEEDDVLPGAVVRVGAVSLGVNPSAGNDGNAPIPYSRLAGSGRKWPRGVDPASREEWLSPPEFSAVFGMSFGSFKRLPWWRRRILKQEVELF